MVAVPRKPAHFTSDGTLQPAAKLYNKVSFLEFIVRHLISSSTTSTRIHSTVLRPLYLDRIYTSIPTYSSAHFESAKSTFATVSIHRTIVRTSSSPHPSIYSPPPTLLNITVASASPSISPHQAFKNSSEAVAKLFGAFARRNHNHIEREDSTIHTFHHHDAANTTHHDDHTACAGLCCGAPGHGHLRNQS